MKNRNHSVLWTAPVAALLLMTGCATVNGADEQNYAEAKGEHTEAVDGVELLELGQDLAEHARHTGDAAMMVQAARIIRSVSTDDIEAETERGGDGTPTDASAGDRSYTALLDEAQVLADGDERILAMIDDVRNAPAATRGRVGGPGVSDNVVNARASNFYRGVTYRGGERAVLSLRGDGDTDLDLYVTDENGNEICAAISWDDRERCEWTPAWTGSFTIEVRNLGSVWNAYRLTTN